MCVESGITQFLDIGSGIPTVGNVHEIAQTANPECRVVYVDIDQVAVSHTRQILAGNERATVIRGDLRNPGEILAASEVRRMLDFTQPIALILNFILHFIHDSDDPVGIIRQFHDELVPGSYLVIAHGSRNTEGMPSENVHSARELYERTVTQVSLRSRPEVMALFEGWELEYPGLVWIPQWRPDAGVSDVDAALPNAGYAGVARKL
jgi:SAM-dependent methyltransferase